MLVRRFPDLPVYVHERGAPHLVDPSKLLASAKRVYGDEMDTLWGEFAAVPEAQHPRADGRRAVRGLPRRVHARPRRAPRHLPARGDAATRTSATWRGIRIPPHAHTYAPTPPPDIDIPAWLESLELVAGSIRRRSA